MENLQKVNKLCDSWDFVSHLRNKEGILIPANSPHMQYLHLSLNIQSPWHYIFLGSGTLVILFIILYYDIILASKATIWGIENELISVSRFYEIIEQISQFN